MALLRNPTRPRESKQSFQFWLVLDWFLYEILLENGNRSNVFNFEAFLNGSCMKSYQTTKIEATFAILTRFWMVFVWNPTRARKSTEPSQFWPVFEWSLYEILLDHANPSNLFNFHLTWIVSVWAPSRHRKKKQPSQFWPGYDWSLYEILLDHGNRSNLIKFYSFLNGFCMK